MRTRSPQIAQAADRSCYPTLDTLAGVWLAQVATDRPQRVKACLFATVAMKVRRAPQIQSAKGNGAAYFVVDMHQIPPTSAYAAKKTNPAAIPAPAMNSNRSNTLSDIACTPVCCGFVQHSMQAIACKQIAQKKLDPH